MCGLGKTGFAAYLQAPAGEDSGGHQTKSHVATKGHTYVNGHLAVAKQELIEKCTKLWQIKY